MVVLTALSTSHQKAVIIGLEDLQESTRGCNSVNNFMSCHRFNLIRCHKSAHFPVMLSIAYTIVLSYLFASSQDSVSQAAA